LFIAAFVMYRMHVKLCLGSQNQTYMLDSTVQLAVAMTVELLKILPTLLFGVGASVDGRNPRSR
jgi:hypothetical protein